MIQSPHQNNKQTKTWHIWNIASNWTSRTVQSIITTTKRDRKEGKREGGQAVFNQWYILSINQDQMTIKDIRKKTQTKGMPGWLKEKKAFITIGIAQRKCPSFWWWGLKQQLTDVMFLLLVILHGHAQGWQEVPAAPTLQLQHPSANNPHYHFVLFHHNSSTHLQTILTTTLYFFITTPATTCKQSSLPLCSCPSQLQHPPANNPHYHFVVVHHNSSAHLQATLITAL